MSAPRVCACGCGRELAAGTRLVVSARTRYATPQCSALAAERRTLASRAARCQSTYQARRAADLCPRCGARPPADRVYCDRCRTANNVRNAMARDAPTSLPAGVMSNARIEAIYRRTLQEIRRARLAGDPRWFVEPFAQRTGYVQEMADRGPDTRDVTPIKRSAA